MSKDSSKALEFDSLAGVKILFVVGPMVLGGAELQAVALARQLRDRFGAIVEFWGIYGDGGPLIEHLEEHGIPWRIVHAPVIGAQAPWFYRLRQVKLLFGFLLRMRSASIDVVLPFMTLPNIVVSLVWRMTSARVCVWNQRSDGSDAFTLGVQGSARLAARLVSVFVANSQTGCDYMSHSLGVSGSEIHLVHNGVGLRPAMADREEWRLRLGIDSRAFIVTMIANLHPPKDHVTLLRSWRIVHEELKSQGRTGVLALAGRPVSTHHTLSQLASELGIEESVRFLGLVRDISGLLQASDLAAFASEREGMPNGVLESMAAGLAVVATDLPGVREALGADCDAVLAPCGNWVVLADRILYMANNEDVRLLAGGANRSRIEMEFSEVRMGTEFAEIISRRL
jgi:glycosyltransferase involved in cell wall biosynthesis